MNPKTKRAVVVDDNPRDLKFWRGRVAETASGLMGQRPLYSCAIVIEIHFALKRPIAMQRHPMAMPTKKPDLDKLTRAIFDALTSVVYVDDALIVDLLTYKRYVGHPQATQPRPGVTVRVFGYV